MTVATSIHGIWSTRGGIHTGGDGIGGRAGKYLEVRFQGVFVSKSQHRPRVTSAKWRRGAKLTVSEFAPL